MELFKRRFGHNPDTLSGLLAWDNKLNFQVEWFRHRQLGLSPDEAALAAIKNISFGRHRLALGYDKFSIEMDPNRFIDVDLPSYGRQTVPDRIEVEVRKGK
jgi:hypothetical protein